MRLVRNPQPTFEHSEKPNRRNHGRLRCVDTHSTLGEVLDLSASGLRVVRRGRCLVEVGAEFAVIIRWDEVSLAVKVKAIRVQKSGFRKFEYGLQFMDLTDETRNELTRIAKLACNEFVIVGGRNGV